MSQTRQMGYFYLSWYDELGVPRGEYNNEYSLPAWDQCWFSISMFPLRLLLQG